MSDRPDVLVTRPIMEGPLRTLESRCDVTVHENDFGIPRDELLKVVAGRELEEPGAPLAVVRVGRVVQAGLRNGAKFVEQFESVDAPTLRG